MPKIIYNDIEVDVDFSGHFTVILGEKKVKMDKTMFFSVIYDSLKLFMTDPKNSVEKA